MSKEKLSNEVVESEGLEPLQTHLTELEGRILILEEAVTKLRNIADGLRHDTPAGREAVAEEIDELTDLLDL